MPDNRFLLLLLSSLIVAASSSASAQPLPASISAFDSQLSPTEVAVAVKAAPYSKLFTVGSVSFVKDKDFNASQPKLRFSSLWIDVPGQDILEVGVRYCVGDTDIASQGAYLAQVNLLDGSQLLVRIKKIVSTTPAQDRQIQAARYIPPTYGFGFWGGWIADPGTYFPSEDCSTGSTRFDLVPVKQALAALPNRTLNVQLLYNNGTVQNWQLGGGTVQALKQLPDLGGPAPAPTTKPAGGF
ncbi:hypothetical protein [Gloeobacter kilaueensis]|uniref:Uncharacterized protein n=1 Tax=Gloeobacter kilaueensis (strain ATCC BAA-2537 / CCAP 1431/1 / ULC 316 / JS1) TaxID=1183438 RepID=U5QMF2_GLOK1|nr:hypothetical protein [Gloeobacter kilaueensis]AGY58815.1 hypothetical protein GKIL_2569 [Gloeobacter kilaueensis JS1]